MVNCFWPSMIANTAGNPVTEARTYPWAINARNTENGLALHVTVACPTFLLNAKS